ncbi:MAG TPA: hypothetical protein VGE29_07085 [Prosthecobacter sp.]
MLTPTDIADYGERHVEKWLKENGYRCYHNTRQGAKDLEARSSELNMLVHVNASLEPKPAPTLSHSDHDSVCARAMMLGFDPWLAQVQIDRHGDLYHDIVWTKLS